MMHQMRGMLKAQAPGVGCSPTSQEPRVKDKVEAEMAFLSHLSHFFYNF
jgi:hypothetical protein